VADKVGDDKTYDGVLGGYGRVSPADITDSRKFLESHARSLLTDKKEKGRSLRALDCGAGVGRVTQELLLDYFDEVDLVEPVVKLLEAAKTNLITTRSSAHPAGHHAREFFAKGLQELDQELAPLTYDVIWIQWALLYLTDEDARKCFDRCVRSLRPGGLIFIKENVCASGFVVDKEDSSITRSHDYMLELLHKCGLKLVSTKKQTNFPAELFDVRMYACRGA